jgi:hypothetical protein
MKAPIFKTINNDKMINSIVGKKGINGCDFVEVVSIIVNGFVNVKSMHPNDNDKVFSCHVDEIEFM